jgi:outer membrane protein TolC
VILSLGCLASAGCARYEPLPLPPQAQLAASLGELRHPEAPLPAVLTVEDVAALAVDNSPDLVAARAQRGLAHAQVTLAATPANPSVNGAVLPLVAGVGTSTAYNGGLGYDFKSLITRRNRTASAEDAARAVDAQVLWQEWQTIGQARLLAVDLMLGAQSLAVLHGARALLAGRVERTQTALAAGNATLTTLATDMAALQSMQAQAATLTLQQLQRRHQLNALLGLLPDVAVPLADSPELPAFDGGAAIEALPGLPQRRPDLLALKYGYESQDQKLRAAILAQFPNLTIGVTGGSDNSDVRNFGPQITLELPIFDHNLGNIAVERATREKLYQEYKARTASADAQVRALVSEIALLTRQLANAQTLAPPIRRAAAAANTEFEAGNLDERGFVDLVTARLAKEQEIIATRQSLLEQEVAIATLLGSGMRSIPSSSPRN